jgi:hypothetical protein
MATADIQASTEQVFVLRCGGRLGAHIDEFLYCREGQLSQLSQIPSTTDLTWTEFVAAESWTFLTAPRNLLWTILGHFV